MNVRTYVLIAVLLVTGFFVLRAHGCKRELPVMEDGVLWRAEPRVNRRGQEYTIYRFSLGWDYDVRTITVRKYDPDSKEKGETVWAVAAGDEPRTTNTFVYGWAGRRWQTVVERQRLEPGATYFVEIDAVGEKATLVWRPIPDES